MNDTPGPADRSRDIDRQHSREYVTLRDYVERLLADVRDYFERLLKDHASLHLKEAAATEREAALVRTVLEQRMTDHDLRHDEQHKSDLRAVDQAREALENRLEKLNELRQEVTSDRGQYITRAVFESKLAGTDKERIDLRNGLEAVRQELAAARGRQAAFAAIGGIALVVVPFVILLVFRIVGA